MTDKIKDDETGSEGFDDEFAKLAAEKDGAKLEPVFTKDPDDPEETLDIDPEKKLDEEADPEKKTVDEDPYTGMDEATKARFLALEQSNQQLQHRIDSDDGRVGAFQRKVNSLEEQLEEISKKTEKPAATEEEIAAAMATDEGWNSFKDEYPEQALAIEGYMDKRLEGQNTEIDSKINKVSTEVNEAITPVTEKIAEQSAIESAQAVENEYPGWQDAVKQDIFSTWLESQPDAVRSLASSDNANDASSLIGLYDNYRVANKMESLRNTDHGDPVVDNSTDEIAERRTRQLEDGTAIKSKSARIDPSAGGSETEFEAVFNAIAKRKDAHKQA